MAQSTFTTRKLNAQLVSACLIGFTLSYYAYTVETAKEANKSYEALCDINDRISCSKVFMSEYGKGFGLVPKTSPFNVPNSIYGLIFYSVVAGLSSTNNYSSTLLVVLLSISSNLSAIYLATILYALKSICVICVGMYVLNFAILLLSIKKFSLYRGNGKKQATKSKKTK